MAITNSTTPYQLHAAFNEVLYTCTSDRYDVTPLIWFNNPTSGVSDNGSGFCRFTSLVSHNFIVGDVLLGAGFTTATTYNVLHTITTVVSSKIIDTDIAFTSSDITGTLTRQNDNFKIIVDIKDGSTVIASQEAVADSSGDFSFDISGILANEIDNNGGHDVIAYGGSDGIISAASINSALNYNLTFTEWFDDSDGILTSHDTLNVATISGEDIYGYNTALSEKTFSNDVFLDYVMSGSSDDFLTKGTLFKKDGEEVFVSFLTEEATAKFKFTQYDSAGSPSASTDGAETINNNMGVCVINDTTLPSNKVRVDIQILDSADAEISEVLSIYRDDVCTKNETRIEFKNRLGGMDSYSFRDAEARIRTSPKFVKIDDVFETLSINPKKEITLIGKPETAEVIEWLEELYTSDTVYLTDNTTRLRVAVNKSTALTQTRDLIRPKVSIRLSDPKLN